jgi:hypothetical protein
METRIIDQELYIRTHDPVELAAWTVTAGWTSGEDFETSTGNTLSALIRMRLWIRTYVDGRGRRLLVLRGHRHPFLIGNPPEPAPVQES